LIKSGGIERQEAIVTVRSALGVNLVRAASALMVIALANAPAIWAQAQSSGRSGSAVPIDPIEAILNAFKSHRIVALGEGDHNNIQGHIFRLTLIRDPRFAATVNDIVVEAGNSRYQHVMDRFVRGEDVPYEVLRQVWQNAGAGHWDVPIYEEFYRAVRSLNAALPRKRQLRILLGDPGIDWNSIKSREDWGKQVQQLPLRDAYAAALVRREVLARGRRALIVYGDNHYLRNPAPNWPPQTIVAILEKETRSPIFTIWTNTHLDLEAAQADISSWPRPSLTILRGTDLATKLQLQGQFDALIYLGPPSSITFSQLTPALCQDRAYMQMRSARIALMGLSEDWRKKRCAEIASH